MNTGKNAGNGLRHVVTLILMILLVACSSATIKKDSVKRRAPSSDLSLSDLPEMPPSKMRVIELGAPAFLPDTDALNVEFSLGPNAGNPKLPMIYVFSVDSAMVFSRALTFPGVDSVWKGVDLRPFIPQTLGGAALEAAKVYAMQSFAGLGPDRNGTAVFASILAYYKRPDADPFLPRTRVGFILRQAHGESRWSVVFTSQETPGNRESFKVAQDFVFSPLNRKLFAFVSAMQKGTAEQEQGGALESGDDGVSWREAQFQSAGDDSGGSGGSSAPVLGLPFMFLLPIPGTTQVWAATNNPCRDWGGVMYSTDGGRSFRSAFDLTPTRNVGDMLFLEPERKLIIAAGHQGSSMSPTGGPVIFEVDPATLAVGRKEVPFEIKYVSCLPGQNFCNAAALDDEGTALVQMDRATWKPLARYYMTDLGSGFNMKALGQGESVYAAMKQMNEMDPRDAASLRFTMIDVRPNP